MNKNNDKNKYNLSRYIPSHIKQQIRVKYGFGCVICGCGIYEYEHINPPFKDCKEHRVEGMTLLCPSCHAKKKLESFSQ